jgi:LysM repeat protein
MPDPDPIKSEGKFKVLAKKVIDFENWSFSFGSVIKLIALAFALGGAWYGIQSSLSTNKSLLTNISDTQKEGVKKVDQLSWEVRAIRTTQEVQFRELSNIMPHRYYTVRRGDNLWIIADKLNVDVQTLIDMNNVADPERLQVGTVIKYPKNARPAQTVESAHSTVASENP